VSEPKDLDLAVLITRIQRGDRNAYAMLVQRFQDMAVGYAYAALGNMQLAEDAAQEAFIDAYYVLSKLREAAAFPGWFRRIVHTHVHRLQRRQQLPIVPLEQAAGIASAHLDPATVVENRELQDTVYAAIQTLPEAQRQVATLFYISEYSYQEIGAFLGIRVSTVKMRLYYARKRLQERMILMLRDTLYSQRPSRNASFQRDIQTMIELVKARTPQRVDDYPSVIDLREISGVTETANNTRLWESRDGELLAFAIVNPRYSKVDIELKVPLAYEEIMAEIVDWATTRMREAGLKTLRTSCRNDNKQRIALLTEHGFVPEPAGTLHLQRSLLLPIPEPQLPFGFSVRPVAGEEEVEKLVKLHRAAFGTENMTVDYRLAMMRVPDYDRSLDLVALTADGELAAFCVGTIPAQENALTGHKNGWLDPIGTHPQFQRRGLARALLLTGLHLLKQRGMENAMTNTWEENWAMRRSTESVGFSVAAKTIWFVKHLL
jgi:RNA polymerase sigma factor (sigma-70 family)